MEQIKKHKTVSSSPSLPSSPLLSLCCIPCYPSQEQEVFFDTINTPTVKKKLQKVSAQDPGESRRRWQRVTEALFSKDIEEATDAKHEVSPLVEHHI